jgi:hypothetical protein
MEIYEEEGHMGIGLIRKEWVFIKGKIKKI